MMNLVYRLNSRTDVASVGVAVKSTQNRILSIPETI